jgi:protocatechuate 3,4-dioxygenase beta subunit
MERSLRHLAAPALALLLAAPAAAQKITGWILPPAGGQAVPSDQIQIELTYLNPDYRQAVRRLRGEPDPPLATARPRPDGSFEIAAPAAGLYRVVVRAEGFPPLRHDLGPLIEETELPPAQLRQVPAEARNGWLPAEADAVTGPEGRGPAPLALEVRDARGNRVPGALVQRVWRAEGLTRPVGLTDAEGRLRLPLSAEAGETLLVETEDGRMVEAEFPVQATGRPWTIELPAPEVVTGRVLDAAGRAPLPGALVWLEQPFFRGTLAAADGSFRLPVLLPPQNDAYFWAGAPGRQPALEAVSRRAGGERREPVTILLRPASSLSGLVVDAAGRPVDGAEVQVERRRDAPPGYIDFKAWSGADGRFRLRPLLPGETYRLTASRTGFTPGTTVVRTGPEGAPDATTRIVLSQGLSAHGRVVDPAGRAVAGAEVLLVPTPAQEESFSDPHLPPGIVRASTDAQGAFELRLVPPGRFDLAARHPGFAPLSRSGLAEDGPGRLDLGVLTLAPGAVLEGKATDGRGAPVSGAEIGYHQSQPGLPSQTSWFDRLRTARVTTAGDGTFRIEGLSPGAEVTLDVRRQGYKEQMLETGVPAPAPLHVRMQAVHDLTGRVVGPGGEPPPGASVTYVIHQRGARSTDESAPTDGEGRFRLTGVLPGPVHLEAYAPGYKVRFWEGEMPDTGEARPVEIALERGEVLEGRVLDGEGNPVANVGVTSTLGDLSTSTSRRQSLARPNADGVTDSDGRYLLDGLDTGLHTVWAVQGQRRTRAKIEIEPGVNRLDLTFQRETRTEVSGRVLDDRGAPVAGAKVELIPGAGGLLREVSAGDGTFRFAGVPAGSVHLRASLDGFMPATESLTVGDSPVHGVDLRLAPGGAITGRLLGVKPEELAGVRISAASIHTVSGRPDRDGRYRLQGLAPGEWYVTVHLSPRHATWRKVLLEPGAAEAVLDFDLTADLVLSGRITIDGAPLGRAEVGLQPLDGGSTTASTTTIPNLPFRIDRLTPGSYTLKLITYSPQQTLQRQVQLSSDLEVTASLSTGTVQGRILSSTGKPIDGTVSLKGTLGEWTSGHGLYPDDQGRIQPERIFAGTYEVRVQGFDGAEGTTLLDVAPGSVTELEVVLGPPPASP